MGSNGPNKSQAKEVGGEIFELGSSYSSFQNGEIILAFVKGL